jgi:hypothetical protein
LVAERGREFYIELLDTRGMEECSQLVVDIVPPQLWHGRFTMLTRDARRALLVFLTFFDEEWEIVMVTTGDSFRNSCTTKHAVVARFETIQPMLRPCPQQRWR